MNATVTLPTDRKRAGGVTAGYVLVVLLLLFLVHCPAAEEDDYPAEGVMINFGTTTTGAGDETPETVEEAVVEPTQSAESQPTEVTEEVETQDVEETVVMDDEAVESNPEVTEQATEEAVDAEETDDEPAVNQDAIFGEQSVTTNDASEGSTEGGGDQGVPDGSQNSDIYDGMNSGLGDDGFGWSLDGRSLVAPPRLSDESQKTGRVVIDIKVDNTGTVTNASYSPVGSTTTDAYLIQLAIQASRTAKFNTDPEAPFVQKGQFIYVFKVR